MKSNTFEAFRPVFHRVVKAFLDAVHQHVGIDPRDLEDMPREDENAAVTRMFAPGSPMLASLSSENIEILCEWGNLARGVYCDVVALTTDGEQLWVEMNHSDVFDAEETQGADESFERLTAEVSLLLSLPVVVENDEDLAAQDYRTPKMVNRGSFWPHQESIIRAQFPWIVIVDEDDQERAQQVIKERQLQEQDDFLSDVRLDYVTLVDGMYAFKSQEEAALFATFVPTREVCTIEDVWND